MITDDDRIVEREPSRKAGKIVQHPYVDAGGLTVTPCGECRTATELRWRANVRVGYRKETITVGAWDRTLYWREHDVQRTIPVLQQVWVCRHCYSRAKNPIQPARPDRPSVTVGMVKRDGLERQQRDRETMAGRLFDRDRSLEQ
jgi:hypothetical protein